MATAVFLLLYTPSVILALWSLFMAYTSDPGAVPLGARPLVTVKRAEFMTENSTGASGSSGSGDGINNDGVSSINAPPPPPPTRRPQRALRRCHKCNDNYKPNRAHHDSVTGRCIVKFDHFCPWVGNAIGALNHKFFVLFVGYTMISCVFALVLIVMRSVHCGLPSPSAPGSTTGASTTTPTNNEGQQQTDMLEECRGWDESYLGLILLVVSVVFGVFTSCMLCEQIDAIKTNTSKIARMKMRVGDSGTELSRVTEEFNEMFGGETNELSWHWFVPLPVEFPRGMEKVVLGYEWDVSFENVPYQEPSNDNRGNGVGVGGSVDIETGGDGRLQVELTTARAPSRTPSSSSSKEKNSDHTVTDVIVRGEEEAAFDATPVPSPIRSRSPLSRRNSRGTLS